MLTLTLLLALVVTLALLVVGRRYTSALTSLACLLAAALVVLYLQDSGLWPASPGSRSSGR